MHGELSLTPTIYGAQGELADLTVFRWKDAAGDHAVGLNVWEPLTEAVTTLKAIVSTLEPKASGGKLRPLAVVDGVQMTEPPPWLSELCRTPPMLRVACPSAVPSARLRGAYIEIVPTPPSERPNLRSLFVSVEYWKPGWSPSPPGVHFDLTVGHVVSSKHLARPVPIDRLTLPKGYAVTRPISLGRRRWTVNPGRLVFGDCFGNHLCYRWRRSGRDYQIDLHAWEPVAQTVHVLRAIVLSTPAGRR